MKFDENLAAVHAYLCADGYVIRNPATQKQKYYMLGFRNTNLNLLKDFQEKFEKVFGIRPHLDEGQRCRLGSKEIYEELTENFGSFYSWDWKMPNMDNELTRIWLRAYFDCEGWVFCKSHQNRHIGADCVNKEGIYQINSALERLGINSLVKKRNTRNIFSLVIYGKENLINFKDKIGFLHPDKYKKLKKLQEDYVEYGWIFPANENDLKDFVARVLKEKAKVKKDSGVVRIISKKEGNLLRLQKELNRLLDITSKVNNSTNGLGKVYFELGINKQEDVKKLADNNLLSGEQQEKWKKIRLKS